MLTSNNLAALSSYQLFNWPKGFWHFRAWSKRLLFERRRFTHFSLSDRRLNLKMESEWKNVWWVKTVWRRFKFNHFKTILCNTYFSDIITLQIWNCLILINMYLHYLFVISIIMCPHGRLRSLICGILLLYWLGYIKTPHLGIGYINPLISAWF